MPGLLPRMAELMNVEMKDRNQFQVVEDVLKEMWKWVAVSGHQASSSCAINNYNRNVISKIRRGGLVVCLVPCIQKVAGSNPALAAM